MNIIVTGYNSVSETSDNEGVGRYQQTSRSSGSAAAAAASLPAAVSVQQNEPVSTVDSQSAGCMH